MRFTFAAAAAVMIIGSPAFAGDPIAPVNPGHSATKVRDIQGFALGMPIKEAMKRFAPTYAQGDQVQGKLGDIELTFGTCSSGAVYFIESTQPLGHFTVDKTFLDALDSLQNTGGVMAPPTICRGTLPNRFATRRAKCCHLRRTG